MPTMARTVLLVVALVLVGLGVWVVLRADAADAIAGEAIAAAASASRASGGPESAPEAERTKVAVGPEVAPSNAPQIPSDAKWLDVLVVDKTSGEPVAGAEVAWSDGTTFERLPVAEQNVWLGRDM